MKKVLFSIVMFLFAAGFVSGQKADLLVKSSENGLYLDHKVAPKENFYSVGRLYNISPRTIASFNKLDMNKGLRIDQKIRIPLTDSNFTQQGNTGTPVYYKTGDKEGLMNVSKANKDVSLDNLRAWNALTDDNIKPGTKLIIGFLMTREMTSVTIKDPVIKTEEKQVITDPVSEKKALKKEAKAEEKAEKKEEKKEAEPIIKKEPEPVIKKEPEPVEKKEEKKETEPPVIKKEDVHPLLSEEGYFKAHFEQQVKFSPVSKNETVTAGIFKTASGWQDAKYYLLIDAVQPGTIIKVVNPTNNKVIYAKVLGEMSGIRQNEGLNIRLSNAAVSALQITEQDKFIVKVNY